MLSVWVWTKFYWVYHWMVTQSSSFEHWTEKLLWYFIMGLWFGRLAAENWTKIYRYQLPHMLLVPLHMYFSTNWCFHKFNFLQRVTFCLCILFAASLQKVFFSPPLYTEQSQTGRCSFLTYHLAGYVRIITITEATIPHSGIVYQSSVSFEVWIINFSVLDCIPSQWQLIRLNLALDKRALEYTRWGLGRLTLTIPAATGDR